MSLDIKKRFNFSIHVLLYLAFILDVVISDYIYYIVKYNYNLIFIGCSFLTALGSAYYIRKVGIVKTEYNFLDISFLVLLAVICTVRAIMPDMSFDTSNYHIYFQLNLGRDFINRDFFAVRSMNAQTIALGDRMFGVFHRFLGYRMGTALNTLAVLLTYLQLKKLISFIGESVHCEINDFIKSAICFICLLTENIYSLLATYMIDLLSVPILIQMLLIVLNAKKEDNYNRGGEVFWLCVMAGILFGIKVSNLLLVLPLAIIYICINWQSLRPRTIAIGILGAMFVISLYLYISFNLTGNPFFPYLNSVFQSKWFTTEYSPNDLSSFNSRFGPKGVWEIIFWPVYMIIYPEKTSDIAFCSGRLLITCIVFLIYGTFEIWTSIKSKNTKFRRLTIILLLYYALFVFILGGYMRYIIVLELMASAMAMVLVYKFMKKRKSVFYLSTIGLMILFCVQIYVSSNTYFNKNFEWSWRDIHDKTRIAANLKKVFHDYGSDPGEELLEDIQTLMVVDHSGSLSYMLEPKAQIINLTSAATNEFTHNSLLDRLEQMPNEGIYSLQKNGTLDVDSFSKFGLKIIGLNMVCPYFCDALYSMPLFKLEKDSQAGNCEYQESNASVEFQLSEEDLKITLFLGDRYDAIKDGQGFDVSISFYKGEETKVIASQRIESGRFTDMEITIDPDDNWEGIVIEKINNNDGIQNMPYTAVLQRFKRDCS